MIESSLSCIALAKYLEHQLKFFFPDMSKHKNLQEIVYMALEKIDFNFSFINLKHYYREGHIYFNHLNSDQNAVFLYYASNIAYEIYSDEILASKLFYLNKTLNQFHCMYNTKLPDIFLLIHSSGIVLGKAKYDNFFVASHHCTIGANAELEYPAIGKFTVMYPYASIIGKSILESNIYLSNGSFVNDTNINKNTLVFGKSPHLILKENKKNRLNYFFNMKDSNEK